MDSRKTSLEESKSETAEPILLRMRDLVRESGLSRETIHFYKNQGLLPKPLKKHKNSAVYGVEHLSRLRQIQELKERQFLPLRAIRALFEGVPKRGFTEAQKQLLHEMRKFRSPNSSETTLRPVSLEGATTATPKDELESLLAAGLLGPIESDQGLSGEDIEILQGWRDLKAIGIGPARGFSATDLSLLERTATKLVEEEFALFVRRYSDASGADAIKVVDRAIPILDRILAAYHRKKVREFIDQQP